jgi:hypothetical protein
LQDTGGSCKGAQTPNSYGGHPSYAQKGRRSPDFVVAKATGKTCDDRIVLIIEIKTGKASQEAARTQLKNYMQLATKKRSIPAFPGILVWHTVFDYYKVSASGEVEMMGKDLSVVDRLFDLLCEISIEAENVQQ